MAITIHDRVRIIKAEQELDTSGGGGETLVPPHGETHVALGSDPVPPEIDGIEADMAGIVDGQVPTYEAASGTFVAGAGGTGGVTLEQARTAGDQFAGDVDYDDNEIQNLKALNFNLSGAGTAQIYWDEDDFCAYVDNGLGHPLHVGRDSQIEYLNDTGLTITRGSVLSVNGAAAHPVSGNILLTAILAKADRVDTLGRNIMVATHDVINNESGVATHIGKVYFVDTSAWTLGDALYISDTVAGELTNVRPTFPSYVMFVGTAMEIHATEGKLNMDPTSSASDTFENFWNGVFRESFDFRTSSNGSAVTGSLEASDLTNDLTMIFSDGFTILDTTPAVTVALTAGSDTIPQTNYVYVLKSAKVLAVSTSGWPTTEHIKVASIVLKTAATTELEGALKNQNFNDHVEDNTGQGHLSHITDKLRQFEAQWDTGIEGSSDITTNVVTLQNTSGYVYQLHRHFFANKDTRQYSIDAVSTGSKTFTISDDGDLSSTYPDGKILKVNGSTGNDGIYTVASTVWSTPNFIVTVSETIPDATVDGTIGDDASVVNDSVAPFVNVSDLTDLTLDALGVALNNTSFSLVVWGVANKGGEVSHLMLNLPTGGYSKNFPALAESDASNYAVYEIPSQFQGTGFLIARHIYVNSGGTWSLYSTEDLRGRVPNATAGGGAGGTGATSFLGLTDTDSSYSGAALQYPRVNAGETAIEFTDELAAPYVDHTAGLADPSLLEGRVFYDDDSKCLAVYNDRTDTTMKLGRASYVRAWNNTGAIITPSQVVYVQGATLDGLPRVALAAANNTDADNVLAISNEEIAVGDEGELIEFGLLGDLDTSAFGPGEALYLDDAEQFTNILPDGNMELSGVASWSALDGATLTKETDDPHEGLQCLRCSDNNANSFASAATPWTVGKTYRIAGWGRSDGSLSVPRVYEGGTILWPGTNSTAWQYFDFIRVATTPAVKVVSVRLNGYAEFDDLKVIDLSALSILVDGDMESATIDDWTSSTATLSKSTASPHSLLQALRVAYAATPNGYAVRILTQFETYNVRGWARGNGTSYPVVSDSGVVLWTGTTSTSWQYFEILNYSMLGITLRLLCVGSSGWVEYDDITVLLAGKAPGTITNVAPTYPDKVVQVGYCTEVHATTGSMLVTIKDVPDALQTSALDDLTDVTIASVADQDCLEYNSVTGLWENVDGVNALRLYGTDIEELLADGEVLGPQLMVDSTCEASGVTDWTASGSATLTKFGTSSPPGGGTQSMKIAYNGVANPRAQQDVAKSGTIEFILAFWARSDGTNGGNIGNGATTFAQTIDSSADWKPYVQRFTGSSLTVWFQAASVAAAYISIDNVFLWEIRTGVPVSGKHYEESHLENLLTYSEEFDAGSGDWTNINATVNQSSGLLSPLIDKTTGLPVEYQAIQAASSAGSTQHSLRYVFSGMTLGDSYVLDVFMKAGTLGFVSFEIADTPSIRVYFDLETGETSFVLGEYQGSAFEKLPGGDVHIRLQFKLTATLASQLRVFVANASGGVTFTGDDSDGIYLTGMHLYKGTLADDLPYVKTIATPETGRQEFLLEDTTPTERRTKKGLLERVVNDKPSGIFETPKNDVLYVAPDHMQHLGSGDRVYAQSVVGYDVVGDVTATVAGELNLRRLVAVQGACRESGTESPNLEWLPIGYDLNLTTDFARAKVDGTTLTIERGSNFSGALGEFNVMFYYTIDEHVEVAKV